MSPAPPIPRGDSPQLTTRQQFLAGAPNESGAGTYVASSERMAPSEIAEALGTAPFPCAGRCLERIETHRSWVFLTESRAYKLRKLRADGPLSADDVDSRRRASAQELELNLRLACSVYLGVVPVNLGPGGISVDGDGQVVDWLLEMRRLPRERMLDDCIARGSVRMGEIDALTATLTRFYERCERAPLGGEDYRARLSADMEAKRLSLQRPSYGLDAALIHAVVAGLRAWMKNNARALDARAPAVVEAHGDLRPEHVCLEPEPVVIDCLDFDRQLRLLDPISELSFLALESRRLGAGWIGERVLARYLALTGDVVPGALIHFYQGVHALVRAAVAIWHLDDSPNEAAHWRARANHYLRLARSDAGTGAVTTGWNAEPHLCADAVAHPGGGGHTR